jgi:biopolymer transport protein ExbB
MTGDLATAAGSIPGGVAEALIATACGLAIAVTGLLPFNYMNARAEEAKHEVSDAANALEVIMKKHEGAASR